jgi:NTP pyrophosphatase (non-canonical NTP hydrolase)
MADSSTTVAQLREAVQRFAQERAWEPFHSPKNLVMALAVETAELMEHFLWLECDASRKVCEDAGKKQEIADELADVGCLLMNLSNSLGIDLSDAIAAKMIKNALKYPVEQYHGRFSR